MKTKIIIILALIIIIGASLILSVSEIASLTGEVVDKLPKVGK